MINREALLKGLQREVTALEDDLRVRSAEDTTTDTRLRSEHAAAKGAGRTAFPFESWRDDQITQAAVAWALACVFVRFLEDNGLLPEPLISGPAARRQLALDRRQLFFRSHPTDSDREYLQDVFRSVAKLPATGPLLGEAHNPLWSLAPSGDGAARLLDFFQRIVPETGDIAHDFSDPDWNTRFLGDLYQDLSIAAQKKFALLQTPEFVEEFILDRTLTPATEEFGYKEVTLIDPTCGSGHFLLGAFHRLFDLHVQNEPATNTRELAQRALVQVSGVDINPFAVAIARFRLLLAALKVSHIERLADAPGFKMNLAAGDSLLHGRRFGLATMNLQTGFLQDDPLRHVYEAEDPEALKGILGRQHHTVVGNPPYITVKDNALNQAYRDSYSSCHMKYSLAVPFTERFFELAIAGDASHPSGFVGMITANSFMKREFGKKLIQETLPKLNLTHVIDTSGAYIPGHGTPTVILFGQNCAPVAGDVRTVMGIRGEPSTPDDPSKGQVWQAIVGQLDTPGSESDFVSVADYGRDRFAEHPWSLGGGGAAELKEVIEAAADKRLADLVESIGFASFTGLDDAFVFTQADLARKGVGADLIRDFVSGEAVRDWAVTTPVAALTPYNAALETLPLEQGSNWARVLWPLRSSLGGVQSFGGKTRSELGDDWWSWYRWVPEKYRTPLSIVFAEIATHNHFVLDRGGKVFNRTAPVIKLPPGASEDDHLALLALLNSSTACFWFKQVLPCKGLGGQGGGIKPEDWHRQYVHNGTNVGEFPVVQASRKAIELARALDELAREIRLHEPAKLLRDVGRDLHRRVAAERTPQESRYERAVALQEELDWEVYSVYNLATSNQVDREVVHRGYRPEERAVEVLLRARMASGEKSIFYETQPYRGCRTWHNDGGAERPAMGTRLTAIADDSNLKLLETINHKRRWQVRPWDKQVEEAASAWLLDRLETPAYWPSPEDRPELQTTARLADRAAQDGDFMQVAKLYGGHPDFDVAALVQKLALEESVPALPACRYKPAGLRKRALWERTWDLQRREDAIDARTALDARDPDRLSEEEAEALKKNEVGDIPVPPKYGSGDFSKISFWCRRGKLDVPKERFVSFPHCERESDPSPVVAWAGWDHLQLAQATAAYYVEMKNTEGWPPERLIPLLASLAQLVPWLRQWHNDIDPEFGQCMGDYYAGFVDGECRAHSLTPNDLENWKPPQKTRGRRKKAASKTT